MPSNDYVNTARNNTGRHCFLCGLSQAYINPSFVTTELVCQEFVLIGGILVCETVSCVNVTQRNK
jgi:hypothetical protein